ncbi:MAG: hypothetical protein JNK75_04375 [Betaproteobacteria bacterium]|nr:hypothetical protein [Betaproteobacteria bacterium]
MVPARRLRLVRFTTLMFSALLLGAAAGPAQAGLRDLLHDVFGMSGSRSTYERNANGQVFRARVTGSVEFNEAEDDVAMLNGRLTILEKRAGTSRMIDFKTDTAAPGGIRRTFRLNNTDAPIDAAAKAWIREAIGQLARESGLQVESRVKRIHAKGGAAAVLTEVERIESDHSRARHLVVLSSLGALDKAGVNGYLGAVGDIDSDYETRGALTALIRKQALDADAQARLLDRVARMDSSYEQRQVVAALVPTLAAGPQVTAAWNHALQAIDSDYEKRQLVEALTRQATLAPEGIERALGVVRTIDGDYERASALVSLTRHLAKPGAAEVQAYIACTQDIDSDYEKSRALGALVKQATLDKPAFEALIRAVRGIDSDHEAKTLLTHIARRMPADADLAAAYRKAARQLGDWERMEAEKALDRLAL